MEAASVERVIPLLIIAALVIGWNLWTYKHAAGPVRRPLWTAFSASAAAVLYAGAGLIGYTLDRHDRFVAHTAWAGHVIWSEVAIGLLAAGVAVYFWRRAVIASRFQPR